MPDELTTYAYLNFFRSVSQFSNLSTKIKYREWRFSILIDPTIHNLIQKICFPVARIVLNKKPIDALKYPRLLSAVIGQPEIWRKTSAYSSRYTHEVSKLL